MKTILNSIYGILCGIAAVMLASCGTDGQEPPVIEEGEVFYPVIRVRSTSMEMSEGTRAIEPMSPDDEKYIRTMAVFEFDNEGLHDRSSTTYHFVDYIEGTVDGKTGVGTVVSTDYGIVDGTMEGIPLEAYSNGMVCCVANITKEDVDTLYAKYHDQGQSSTRLTLANFKKWSLEFHYYDQDPRNYDETNTGHIKEMYMFGYYEGPIVPTQEDEIAIDFGRLASRLDITIINETGEEFDKRFGYHFDNVCAASYVFTTTVGMPATIQAGLARTVICAGSEVYGYGPVEGDDYTKVPEKFPAGGVHTRYYYVAGHSAGSYEEATKLHLFYDRRIVDDVAGDNRNSVLVPLCNVHPDDADDVNFGYSLSRNTRYHFTIRVKKYAAAPACLRMTTPPGTMMTEYGTAPGEILVYLPE